MEMHQVRYYLAVANELNFSRAAEKCNVSQPSLSRAIQLLEAEFGGQLFRRDVVARTFPIFEKSSVPILKLFTTRPSKRNNYRAT